MRTLLPFVALALAACAPCTMPSSPPPNPSARPPARAPLTRVVALPAGPAPRANATLTYVAAARALVLLGGEDPATGALFDDAWRFDLDARAWTRLVAAAFARVGHAAVGVEAGVFVVGGRAPSGLVADPVIVDARDGATTALARDGAPGAREGAAIVRASGEVVVFGGRDGDGAALADGARYDVARGAWRALSRDGAPRARADAALAWTGAEAVVWGGANDELMPHQLDAAAYDPARDAWRALPRRDAPSPAAGPVAAFAAGALVVAAPEAWALCDAGADRWRALDAVPPRGAAVVACGEHVVAVARGALVAVHPARGVTAELRGGALDALGDAPLLASDGRAVYALFGRAGAGTAPGFVEVRGD